MSKSGSSFAMRARRWALATGHVQCVCRNDMKRGSGVVPIDLAWPTNPERGRGDRAESPNSSARTGATPRNHLEPPLAGSHAPGVAETHIDFEAFEARLDLGRRQRTSD